MKKLRDKDSLFTICAYIIGIMLAGLFAAHHMNGQEKEEVKSQPRQRWQDNLAIPADEFAKHIVTQDKEKQTPAKAEEAAPVKTWKLPAYMQENLQRELNDFNKRFEGKVQAYKKELKTRFKEFADMPNDVILYLEGGFFITRSDLLKLQEQLRDKLTKEVKGDDKTTN